MKQFQWGVAGYVIARAAVIFVPAFVWVEPNDAAITTIYVLQNCVRWLFLAALAWIFRYASFQAFAYATSALKAGDVCLQGAVNLALKL